MSTSPLVTISIPIYNCENYILNCLKSVTSQTYKNIEILLVDDLGNDNSMRLVEEFIRNSPKCNFQVFRNQKNSGLSFVRNVGIDNAKGKYIFFLDSDDEITPDCIEKMVGIAERENVQMACGNVRTVYLENHEEIDAFKLNVQKEKLNNNKEIFEAFVMGRFPVHSWNKLILLDFLKGNKLYFKNGLFAQDDLQTFLTVMKLSSVVFILENTYIYYLHKDSVIHNRNKKHFENWNTIIEEMEKTLKEERNQIRKKLIKTHIINYKDQKLIMNWKAQHNEDLWKYSYDAYKKVATLSFLDYLDKDFSFDLKKKNFLQNLPTDLGYKIFRKRYN